MNILRNVDLTRILVVDIETVPCADSYDQLRPAQQALWDKFCASRLNRDKAPDFVPAEHFGKAGLYAEFGKVVCISVGFFHFDADGSLEFRVKSFASEDEGEALRGFAGLLGERAPYGNPGKLPGATLNKEKGWYLCAHNGREFDYAYLGRRMLIGGIPLPPMLDIAGYKEWELPHLLDTMSLWKFGDYKGHTPLAVLADVFGIPTPKDDIDGSQVGHVFWVEKDLGRIVTYCQKDVETTARVLLRYMGQSDRWDDTRVRRTPWSAPMREA